MPETESWTIGRLLEWTSTYLGQHGSDTPRLDAELLLAHALNCQRIELYTAFGEAPEAGARKAFRELVRRRAEGTPVAYLLGRREFYSLVFQVTSDVLVPRPETEFLLIRLLDLSRPAANLPLRIADIGTGSGILAVCAAHELPGAHVLAVDVSGAALKVAETNALVHGVSDRIEFRHSDVFTQVGTTERFDFVVSNPPYIKTAEFVELPRDVAQHEPRGALEAGPRGTEIIERIVSQSADRLVPRGYLLLEISPQLETDVRELLAANGHFDKVAVTKDLAGRPRVVEARRRE